MASISLVDLSILVFVFLLCANLGWYLFLTPEPGALPLPSRALARYSGMAMYGTAYLLAHVRGGFTLLPALAKLVTFCLLGGRYRDLWEHRLFQLLRACGDILNLWLALRLVDAVRPLSAPIALLLLAACCAEGVRLLAQHGQMLFSASWQQLPHRALAARLLAHGGAAGYLPNWLQRYCHYYALGDEERHHALLHMLKRRTRKDPTLSARLSYCRSFRIVADEHYLRAGHVRDVATGEIFIHRRWTNDPWLLIGLALRRSPWIFDPRYLPRPFYYRTSANRCATLLVLTNARYSPPYAWYQLGHEIKAASFDLPYRLLRWMGADLEGLVRADGTYSFDPLLGWLERRSADLPLVEQRPLWSDDEVICAELRRGAAPGSALEIARRYTYPLRYVEEVLLPHIERRARFR